MSGVERESEGAGDARKPGKKKNEACGPTLPLLPHTRQKNVDGTPTASAHPARFSPDDKFSRERVECKRRFGLLPTQKPAPAL